MIVYIITVKYGDNDTKISTVSDDEEFVKQLVEDMSIKYKNMDVIYSYEKHNLTQFPKQDIF